jgi:hypothetical protein
MALYLYNLGISLQTPYPSQGRFYSAGTSGLMQSGVWMTYQLQTIPPVVQPNGVVFIMQPLTASNWGNPQPDTTPFPAQAGDYLMLRLFLSDSPAPSNCLLRLNVVFGRGTSGQPPASVPLQSPLQLPGGLPRAVVDSDNSTPSQAPTSDNAWVYSVGMIYGGVNDYSFNVGATLTQGANWYTFGHDPQMHVGGAKDSIAA